MLYPDPRLRLPAPPVAAFDAGLRVFADDLLDTLVSASAVSVSALGLTGPHVGAPVWPTIIRAALDLAPRVYVSPELVFASPETARHREGSLSMPGVDEEVERPARVRVRFHDLDGTMHEAEEGVSPRYRYPCNSNDLLGRQEAVAHHRRGPSSRIPIPAFRSYSDSVPVGEPGLFCRRKVGRDRSFGFAPLADIQPQPLEWPLFDCNLPLQGMVESGKRGNR